MNKHMDEKRKSSVFQCDGCGAEIEMAAYAVAQLAMGHAVFFTHRKEDGGCGKKTELWP